MKQLALVIPFLLVFAGCVNTSQETMAYKSLGGIGYTVDGAMNAYADAVVAGQITDSQQAKVRALHQRYQPIYNAAVRAARNDLTTLAPEDVAVIAAELAALILTLTAQ